MSGKPGRPRGSRNLPDRDLLTILALAETLQRISQRLSAIEAKLDTLSANLK